MPGLFKAIIYGIVQGVTEFLPISSSAHLALLKKIPAMGVFGDPHLDKVFDVALHAGTLVAVVVYFRGDLARLFRDNAYRRLVAPILLATLVVLAIGKALENKIEQDLNLAIMVVAPLILFGLLLWWVDRRGRKEREVEQVSRGDVILMTLAQTLALVPGVSRSGITMTTGLWRGMTRDTAVRLSFLLSIPVIAAPPAYFALQVARGHEVLPTNGFEMIGVGVAAAAVSGYLAISGLLKFVKSKSFTPFVVYRVALGLAVVGLLAAGVLNH